MPFTLVYQGPLKPRQRSRRGEGAAALRADFNDQLRERFRHLLDEDGDSGASNVTIGGHHYLPLVRERHGLIADVEIMLLAPHGLRAGDADNRAKALLDGLTRPANAEQVSASDSSDAAHPTFCVLDDDALINRLTLDARPWYGRPPGDRDSLAIVPVTIRANGPTTIWAFGVLG